MIYRFVKEKKREIKIYLDWGLQEDIVFEANRKFVRFLDQLNYDFKFTEFNGWHDWSNSRKTFPLGILYLKGNEKITGARGNTCPLGLLGLLVIICLKPKV